MRFLTVGVLAALLSAPLWVAPVLGADPASVVCDFSSADAAGTEVCSSQTIGETAFLDQPKELDQACSDPATTRGSECVLESDVTLAAPLQVGSSTHLNCQGHRLLPRSPGFGTGFSLTRSQPEVALVLNGAFGAKVQNCVIDGFDFGMLVVNNKLSAQQQNEQQQNDPDTFATLTNKIVSNSINVRFVGITGIQTDNDLIAGNMIRVESGHGINLSRVDNFVRVTGNNIARSTTTAPFPRPAFPGSTQFARGAAGIIYWPGRVQSPLFNLVIGHTLLQFPYTAVYGHAMVIRENIITYPHASYGVLVTNDQRGTIVRGNRIRNSVIGIQEGGVGPLDSIFATFPGHCTQDPTRFAVTNADCFIPGVDKTSLGTVTGVTTQPLEYRSRDTRIEDNTVDNTLGAGIVAAATFDTKIAGNRVSRAGYGLVLAGNSMETATVANNVIAGADFGLVIDVDSFPNNFPPGTFFGAQVSLNDIITSTSRAIATSDGYSLSTELSVSGMGNFWGRTCAQGGFIPFGQPGADSPNPLVTDSHPYGQSVAARDREALPATCR